MTEYFFKTAENEQIETVIHMRPDLRSAIFGTVLSTDEKPVADALVILLTANEDNNKLIARTFTDENGRFCFGPLPANQLHNILIYKDNIKIRELEIVTE